MSKIFVIEVFLRGGLNECLTGAEVHRLIALLQKLALDLFVGHLLLIFGLVGIEHLI